MNIEEENERSLWGGCPGLRLPPDETMEKAMDVDVMKPKIKQLQYKMGRVMLHSKLMEEFSHKCKKYKQNWIESDDKIKSRYDSMGKMGVEIEEDHKEYCKFEYSCSFVKMGENECHRYSKLEEMNEILTGIFESYEESGGNEEANHNPKPNCATTSKPTDDAPPINYTYPMMADIDDVPMVDTSNKALCVTEKEADAYEKCADIIGADVRAYIETKRYTKGFGHDHIPVMLFGDDEGDFLKEITTEQKRAYSEGLNLEDYMKSCWKMLLSTPKPPEVLIAFEPNSGWTPQETILQISHFQEWVVTYNLLLEARKFVDNGYRVLIARHHYLEKDMIPNNGIVFFLSDQNIPLVRAMVARNIREHLDKHDKYWTEL